MRPVRSALTAALVGTVVFAGAAEAEPALAADWSAAPANLIVNGNAERGTGGTGEPSPTLPGWTTKEGAPALIRYNAGGGYPSADDPGPARRGAQYFGGGTSARTRLQQQVTLPDRLAIDRGRLCFDFSGWLGGYANQQDGVRFSVEFLDRDANPVGLAVLGPVSAEERRNITSFLERAQTGTVPPTSRTARVTALFTRADASGSNDGYADNLALTVTRTRGGC